MKVSVVMATHNRPQRLARQLERLRDQTLPAGDYEIIVVDDASSEETVELLRAEAAKGGEPELRVIRREVSGGPAAARNEGWRAARGGLIAFTDDDCEATRVWLEEGLKAHRAHPDGFVQGPISPIPEEAGAYGPFSHTVVNESLGPGFETANIFYPRALLERVGGFDEVAYTGPGGEDTDLAWKCIEAGAPAVWAAEARMHHAVTQLGPMGKIRLAARWHESMLPFKRYAGLRAHRRGRIFWSDVHLWFAQALVALLLPRRLWILRLWLATPYLNRLMNRRSGPVLLPYFVVHDLVEIGACVRGSLRYRVVVL